MGKKKHKGEKHDRKHETPGAQGGERERRAGSFPLPLAGIAAMVTQQLQSPAARAAMATGLRAAADALSKSTTRPVPPQPPVPPVPAAAPQTDAPPHPDARPAAATTGGQAPPQGTTRSPDPHDIGTVLGKAAEQVLGAFLTPRKPR